MADETSTCAALSLKSACSATLDRNSVCGDETLIPWNRIFICTAESLAHDAVAYWAFVAVLVLITLVIMWIGVNLLSKVRKPH